ncbi:hypothetical protein EVAR_33093_1 [Eumeta japonica]|uniref:Uncharacterized protein n=1 Tax=Eumeta variegata TaxID=151549 RepID=A0A4C1YC43_EUMVA|nr:hypothetical protein EVAR_33093_1 [Eumeta japonica]
MKESKKTDKCELNSRAGEGSGEITGTVSAVPRVDLTDLVIDLWRLRAPVGHAVRGSRVLIYGSGACDPARP